MKLDIVLENYDFLSISFPIILWNFIIHVILVTLIVTCSWECLVTGKANFVCQYVSDKLL